MPHSIAQPVQPLITLPSSPLGPLSVRAKALLFHDPASQAIKQQIERLAPTEASVLVIGETGTGKELVARHLHQLSCRNGPFVAVNCGAFSESLIDAELFGHEAGAYTSAGQSRAGWFEAANKGTLFLDEIGDLSLALQVKLLRVLQERQVVRLGSRRPVALDVRVVAATNVDLQRAVTAGRFRADLYYRLKVAEIHVKPLRQRVGDVLPLAEHFMQLYATRMHLGPTRLSAEARLALQSYPWPGNIRELENAIHCGLIVAQAGVVQANDLSLPSHASEITSNNSVATSAALDSQARLAAEPPMSAPAPATEDETSAATMAETGAEIHAPGALTQALADVFTLGLKDAPGTLWQTAERAMVETVFQYSRRNQMQAARLLGVSRNTMRTLLLRHGLL